MLFTGLPPYRLRAFGQLDNIFKVLEVEKHWFYTLMVRFGTSIPLLRKRGVMAPYCSGLHVSLPATSGLQGTLTASSFRRYDLSCSSRVKAANEFWGGRWVTVLRRLCRPSVGFTDLPL